MFFKGSPESARDAGGRMQRMRRQHFMTKAAAETLCGLYAGLKASRPAQEIGMRSKSERMSERARSAGAHHTRCSVLYTDERHFRAAILPFQPFGNDEYQASDRMTVALDEAPELV
jgi:hypothetical protein